MGLTLVEGSEDQVNWDDDEYSGDSELDVFEYHEARHDAHAQAGIPCPQGCPVCAHRNHEVPDPQCLYCESPEFKQYQRKRREQHDAFVNAGQPCAVEHCDDCYREKRDGKQNEERARRDAERQQMHALMREEHNLLVQAGKRCTVLGCPACRDEKLAAGRSAADIDREERDRWFQAELKRLSRQDRTPRNELYDSAKAAQATGGERLYNLFAEKRGGPFHKQGRAKLGWLTYAVFAADQKAAGFLAEREVFAVSSTVPGVRTITAQDGTVVAQAPYLSKKAR